MSATTVHAVIGVCNANTANGCEYYPHRWVDSVHSNKERAEERQTALNAEVKRVQDEHGRTVFTVAAYELDAPAVGTADFGFDVHGIPEEWPHGSDAPGAPFNPDLDVD